MLIVLASALAVAASTRSSIWQQYYDQLAREAAESGLIYAVNCVKKNDFQITWDNTKPLRPNTDCNGTVTSSCAPTANTAGCSVITGSNYISSYAVYVDYNPATQQMVTRAEGSVSQVRKNGAALLYRQSLTQNALVDLSPVSAEYIESGYLQVCGIFDGNTWCWGTQGAGTLGNGVDSSAYLLTPVKMQRLSGALLGKQDKFVAISNNTTCVVTTDNQIYCTGQGSSGQLGNGTTTPSTTPVQVSKPGAMTGDITKIVAMNSGFCAISNGDLYCWGNGTYGRLGNNATSNSNVPIKTSVIGRTASPSRPVIDVASDSETFHVCAIAQVSGAGRAYCWGYDGRNELGDDATIANKSVPTLVDTSGVLAGKNLVQVGASGRYPDRIISNVLVPTDAQVNSCAAAESGADKRLCARTGQSCVLDTAGKVYCWGSNQYGQLGGGASQAAYSPVNPQWRQAAPIQVTTNGLSSKAITDLAVGRAATCGFVGSENKIYCWGRNDRGVLGRGPSVSQGVNYPEAAEVVAQTPGIAGQTIADLTGGLNRFCVVTTVSNAYCWGANNSAGQIGDGTTTNRDAPTEAKMLKKLRPPIVY